MELHRIKPLSGGYDEEIFNTIYKDVQPLKIKLANQIDERRLGVDRDILLSWFDDKILFVFNKYYNSKNPDVLKGFIINSMQVFKCRVLRKTYTNEGVFYSNQVDLEGEVSYLNLIPDEEEISDDDVFLNIVKTFMKERLSEDAYFIHSLITNPPPYIISRLKNQSSRINNKLLMEFLGVDDSYESKLKKLKREISKTIKMAKEELPTLAISN